MSFPITSTPTNRIRIVAVRNLKILRLFQDQLSALESRICPVGSVSMDGGPVGALSKRMYGYQTVETAREPQVLSISRAKPMSYSFSAALSMYLNYSVYAFQCFIHSVVDPN